MSENRDRRTRRSSLLIGVFIGIYGNWLIALVEKLGRNPLDYTVLPFWLSFAFLLFYFQEIFSRQRHFHKGFPRPAILGVLYFLFVLLSLVISGIANTDLLFVAVGAFLWVALMQAERFSGLE